MPVVYKSFNYQEDVQNNPVGAVDAATKTDIDNVVASFVNHFKAKHL